jgi:hypothetical protein
MSSARWPRGTLARALTEAHHKHPLATAPELARIVGCDRACARGVVRSLGLPVPLAKEQRITWTPDMKRALVEGALQRRPADRLADHIGVAPASLVLGAMEVIRELTQAQGGAL